MAIKGDLTSIELAQVFQMMSLNQKEGCLVIDVGGRETRSVLFGRRGLTMLPILDLNDDELLDYIVKRRNIADGDLDAARQMYERPGQRLVDAFRDYGLIDHEWVLDVVRERIQAQLLDLFFITNARFEFEEGATEKFLGGLDPAERDHFFFSVEEVIMEGSQRLDEWEAIRDAIPRDDEIYYQVYLPETVGDDGMPPERYEALMALDGSRDVAEVVEFTGLGSYRVCSHLAELLREGYIEPLSPDQLRELANGHLQAGHLDDAHRLFRRLLEHEPSDVEALLRTALILERLDEPLQAVDQYRKLAEHYLKEASIAQSCEYLQTCLRLIPTDIDTLGRLIGLHLRYGESHDLQSVEVVEQSRLLVQIYAEIRQSDKAVDLLQRLIRSRIDVERNRTQLIELLLAAERHQEAVAELEEIGKRRLRDGNRPAATKIYRQVLALAPDRKDVSRILDEIDQERQDKRRRRRRRNGVVRSSAYLCVFAGAYVYYDRIASRELAELDVRPLIQEKHYDAAQRRLQEFVDRFPFSRSAQSARARIAGIAKQANDYESALERHAEARKGEIRQNLEKAAALFEEAQQAIAIKDLPRALELLERVDDLSEGSERWRTQFNLERNLGDVREHVRTFDALVDRAEAAHAAGRVDDAFAIYRELVEERPEEVRQRGVLAPVRFVTDPPGARLFVDEEPIDAPTPTTVAIPIGRTTSITVTAPGRSPKTVRIRATDAPMQRIVLAKSATARIEAGQRLGSAPDIHGDRGVIGGRDGRLVCVDLRAHTVLWRKRFTGLNDNATAPCQSADAVFTGSVETGLFRLDPVDGEQQWRVLAKEDEHFSWRPLLRGPLVIAAGARGAVVGVIAETGAPVWRASHGPFSTHPVASDRRVFIGRPSGDLIAIDPTSGELVGVQDTDGIPVGMPVIADDALVVVTRTGAVHVFDVDTFEPRWRARAGGATRAAPVVADGSVYVTLGDGAIVRLRLSDGARLAESTGNGTPLAGGAVIGPDGLYVGGEDGVVRMFDGTSLEELWATDLGEPIRGGLVRWGDAIVVTTTAGRIYLFE